MRVRRGTVRTVLIFILGMVPIAQSESLAAALSAAGVDVTFLRISGLEHRFAGPSGQPAVLDPTLDFFDIYLKTP
jgi:dipeptidyl aminopeptidase/acylaminoacyl peptidase